MHRIYVPLTIQELKAIKVYCKIGSGFEFLCSLNIVVSLIILQFSSQYFLLTKTRCYKDLMYISGSTLFSNSKHDQCGSNHMKDLQGSLLHNTFYSHSTVTPY